MDQWTDRLSEYVDDELPREAREACEAHLALCAHCRAAVADLAALKSEARTMPDSGPAADLWPGVLARLAPAHQAPPAPALARRWSFSIGELALAATLLMAVSAGTTWLVANRPAGTTPASGPAVVAVDESFAVSSGVSNDVQLASFADEHYDAAVGDLERVLLEQREELDPQTIRVIERNLQTIDQAIRQARQALEDDPSNPYLNAHLVDSRRRKLALLRRATLLTSVTQGD